VVSHSSFDKRSLTAAALKYNLVPPQCRWLDSIKVVRRTWPQFSRRGYGLENLCKEFKINIQHHDALEDARATAEIMLLAMEQTGLGIEDWMERVTKPISN
jgi:DNA polymerase-3 subunit epsilon